MPGSGGGGGRDRLDRQPKGLLRVAGERASAIQLRPNSSAWPRAQIARDGVAADRRQRRRRHTALSPAAAAQRPASTPSLAAIRRSATSDTAAPNSGITMNNRDDKAQRRRQTEQQADNRQHAERAVVGDLLAHRRHETPVRRWASRVAVSTFSHVLLSVASSATMVACMITDYRSWAMPDILQ